MPLTPPFLNPLTPPAPSHRRLQMLHNVAAGMAYLHSRNYVHGDLRSPNVFVGLDGHVKIGDFGFARLLGGWGTAHPWGLLREALCAGRPQVLCAHGGP